MNNTSYNSDVNYQLFKAQFLNHWAHSFKGINKKASNITLNTRKKKSFKCNRVALDFTIFTYLHNYQSYTGFCKMAGS